MCKANRTAAILILRSGVLLVTGLIVVGEFSIRPENNTQEYITLSLTAVISLALIYFLPHFLEGLDSREEASDIEAPLDPRAEGDDRHWVVNHGPQ